MEVEWSGVEVEVVIVIVSASELCLSMGWSLLLVGEAEACREDCLFILDSRSKLLLVTFVTPEYLVLPLAANYLFDQIFGSECYLIQSGKLEENAGLIFLAALL